MFRQTLWNGMLLSALSVILHAQAPVLTIDDLLTTGGRDAAGVLSPNGKYFAVAQRGQVAIVPVHGGEAKPLTNTPEAKSELSWSRDCQHIAYISQGDV